MQPLAGRKKSFPGEGMAAGIYWILIECIDA